MKTKLIEGKWHVEVVTEEFGNILLLNPHTELAIPIQFDSEKEALDYINLNS